MEIYKINMVCLWGICTGVVGVYKDNWSPHVHIQLHTLVDEFRVPNRLRSAHALIFCWPRQIWMCCTPPCTATSSLDPPLMNILSRALNTTILVLLIPLLPFLMVLHLLLSNCPLLFTLPNSYCTPNMLWMYRGLVDVLVVWYWWVILIQMWMKCLLWVVRWWFWCFGVDFGLMTRRVCLLVDTFPRFVSTGCTSLHERSAPVCSYPLLVLKVFEGRSALRTSLVTALRKLHATRTVAYCGPITCRKVAVRQGMI